MEPDIRGPPLQTFQAGNIVGKFSADEPQPHAQRYQIVFESLDLKHKQVPRCILRKAPDMGDRDKTNKNIESAGRRKLYKPTNNFLR